MKTFLMRMILKTGAIFHVDEQHKLYSWAKELLEENKVEGSYAKIEKWFIRWQGKCEDRPEKTQERKVSGVTTMVRARADVTEVKAFKDVYANGLGTHDIFEYEVGNGCTANNLTMLVRRLGCACARYCMKPSLDEGKKCECGGESAVVMVNNKRVRQRKAAAEDNAAEAAAGAPAHADADPQLQPGHPVVAAFEDVNEDANDSNNSVDNGGDIDEDSDDEDNGGGQPVAQVPYQTWGIIPGGPRKRGKVDVPFCCCDRCHGSTRPLEFTCAADRKTRDSCGHIRVTCWGNRHGVLCLFCTEK